MSPKATHAARGSFARDVTKRAIGLVVIVVVLAAVAFGIVHFASSSNHHSASSTTSTSSLPSASSVPVSSPSSASTTHSTASSSTVAASTTTLPAPTPGNVSVVVLNGTSTVGAAAYFTDKLQNAGYDTLSPLNASTTGVTSSLVVVTSSGTMAGGEAVAHALGLAVSAVSNGAPSSAPIPPSSLSGVDVVVLIGADISSQANGSSTSATTSSTSG